MKIKQLIGPLLILVALFLAGPAAAQSSPPVEAMVTADAAEGALTVGDPIQFTVTVNHPADYHIILPQLESTWGDFIVKSQSPPSTITNDDGTKTTTQSIDARLFAPGTFETPPLTITVTDADGQLSEITAPGTSVILSSVLVEGDTELRDIKPQAELPFFNVWPWVIAGLLLAVVAGIVFFILRKRRARLAFAALDTRLPHEIALDDLSEVEKRALPEQGRFKEHYTLVSETMRTYMGKIYSFPVLERTTAEIQSSVRSTRMSQDVARQFLSLLDESDLVKFSKFTPNVAGSYEMLLLAREIVEATKPAEISVTSANNQSANGQAQMSAYSTGSKLSANGSSYQHTEVGA